jgi:hypothetical protein
VIRPLQARFGAEPIRHLPDATRAQRRAKLERAEALLRGNASGPKAAGPGCSTSRISASTLPQAR